DVAVVAGLPLLVVEVVHDHADGQSEELVDPPHPLRVALGKIVVDRDDVHALSFESVQIDGQRGDQGLAFAGLHFRNLALMPDAAADQLLVEVAPTQYTPASLADDGERLHQQVVKGRALGDPFLEFDRFSRQVDVGELLDFRLEGVDCGNPGAQRLDVTLVLRAENLGENSIYHKRISISAGTPLLHFSPTARPRITPLFPSISLPAPHAPPYPSQHPP